MWSLWLIAIHCLVLVSISFFVASLILHTEGTVKKVFGEFSFNVPDGFKNKFWLFYGQEWRYSLGSDPSMFEGLGCLLDPLMDSQGYLSGYVKTWDIPEKSTVALLSLEQRVTFVFYHPPLKTFFLVSVSLWLSFWILLLSFNWWDCWLTLMVWPSFISTFPQNSTQDFLFKSLQANTWKSKILSLSFLELKILEWYNSWSTLKVQ